MNQDNFHLEVNDDAEMIENANNMIESVVPEQDASGLAHAPEPELPLPRAGPGKASPAGGSGAPPGPVKRSTAARSGSQCPRGAPSASRPGAHAGSMVEPTSLQKPEDSMSKIAEYIARLDCLQTNGVEPLHAVRYVQSLAASDPSFF